MMWIAIFERADGSTFEQAYNHIQDLVDLISWLGPDYKLVAIY